MKEKKDIYILAIESSCDETSCSIVKNGDTDIFTVVLSQIDIHKDFGGVVPEIASRHHVRNITIVIEDTLKNANMTMDDIDSVAVTYGPGLIGSLLVGIEAAKSLAFVHNKPLIKVNHIAGHIYANNLVSKMVFPNITLVVSGGHTELVLMKNHLQYEVLGSTLDDAVGECYDKVARVIDVGYPGGPVIDKLANIGENTYKLPIPLDDDSFNFSYSGLKSAVINLVHNEKQKGNIINKENLSRSFQEVAIEILVKKTFRALDTFNVDQLYLAGGVAANSYLRKRVEEESIINKKNVSYPPIKYCTDNATMIGAVAYFLYKEKRFTDFEFSGKSTLKLE